MCHPCQPSIDLTSHADEGSVLGCVKASDDSNRSARAEHLAVGPSAIGGDELVRFPLERSRDDQSIGKPE